MKGVYRVCVGALMCSVSVPALAQAGDQSSAGEQMQTDAGPTSESDNVIVVTAQRREENLQEVPIAINVVQADALEATGSSNIIDLPQLVPGLNLRNSASFLATSLRGVGSTGKGPGVENPVALYVDGVYYGASGTSLLSLNNISQISVLKGPQGTLFGRNATGGLIQVSTRDPSRDPGGDFSLSLETYGTVIAKGYLGGQIAEGVSADIALFGKNQADGWGTNLVYDEDIYKVDHDYSVRSKWVLEPSDSTRVTIIGDYANRQDSMIALYAHPGTVSVLTDVDPVPNIGYDIYTDTRPNAEGTNGGVSFQIDQELGEITLMSLSAYRYSKSKPTLEYDGTRLPFSEVTPLQIDNQYSQELQLSSPDDRAFKWVAGAYFYYADSRFDSFDLLTGGKQVQILIDVTQTTESYAGYGQASYEFGSGTTVTLGGRYTSEKRHAFDGQQTIINNIAETTTVIPGDDREETFGKFTFRVSIDQKINDDIMAYASFNRGFKSGGFNANVFGTAAYRPETLDAYEAGLKMELLDNAVRLNLAGFYYDYQDMQEQRRLAGATTVINAGSSRIYGLEGELTAFLTDELTLSSGFSWLDPKYVEFEGCPTASPNGGIPTYSDDCSGNQLGMASKFTGNVALNYERDLGSGTLLLTTNLYYNSGFYMQPDNAIKQDRYATINASARYTLESGAYIGVFGRNLSDNKTINNNATAPDGTQFTYFNEPRVFGAIFGYSF